MKHNDDLQINWLMIGLGMFGIGFWYFVFTAGFFQTIAWTIIISALIGIVIKLREQPWR